MASNEKPTTKILVSVASGLVLAGLLYLARYWIPAALRWVGSVFVAAWSWFTASHGIPGWLLLLLSLCGVWCFFRIVAAFRAPTEPVEPQWHDFTEFEFLGVLWRWRYDGRGTLHGPVSFCPQAGCDMQTYGRLGQYYGAGRETTVYRCDRCGHTPEAQGSQEQVKDKVTREIQRLLRCGDWKNHIRPSA